MKLQSSMIAFPVLLAAAVALAWQTPVGPAPAPSFAVQFPSETEMMADPVIQAHATNLWAQTLALCTPTNRHEVGCWIRLDTSTDTYSFSDTIIGPPTPNNQNSGINLLPLPADTPLFPRLENGSAIYTVASFHTHSPTTYRLGVPRLVGPSPDDASASEELSIPGLVVDYKGSTVSQGEFPMGHPIDAPVQLYPTVVCPRRTR